MTRKNVAISVAIVAVLWIGVGFVLPRCLFPRDDQQGLRGTWGDQFGAVNSLFSGLAFAGLLVALYIQNRELAHAIEGQRDAALQQTKVIVTQMILQVTDEIRSHEWGDAHNQLRKYHRSNVESMRRAFQEGRETEHSLGSRHEKNRRTFLEPCYKVHNLKKAGFVTDDAARIVLSPDIVLTLLEIIEPLEGIIRSNYDRSMFDWARELYSEEELKSRGAYIHSMSGEVIMTTLGK